MATKERRQKKIAAKREWRKARVGKPGGKSAYAQKLAQRRRREKKAA